MNRLLKFTISVLAIASLQIMHAQAQYTVAPNAFVITDPGRSTEMIVRLSPDAGPMEFDVNAYFAIPRTDSLGKFVLWEPTTNYVQDISSKIRFSPRRFVLNSGDQQIVRIVITDDDLPQGEYWSRVVVSAKSATNGPMSESQGLSVSMGLEIRTISGLLYRKGRLQSDLELVGIKPMVRNDSLLIDLDIAKVTPAAWIGSAALIVEHDVKGRVFTQQDPANFYVAGKFRLAFPIGTLPSGTYLASLALTTTRDDPTMPLIRAKDLTTTFPIVINP